MTFRDFGKTGMRVSALGLGAGHIGDPAQLESEIATLLNGAIDAGLTLVDTARGYGLSEERIGRHLKHRRSEFVLSTKVGYGVPGRQDWTWEAIVDGVELALKTCQTEYIDIVHLHSCPIEILNGDQVIPALETCKQAGKVRAIAYSGDNDALEWAVYSGKFHSIETSINICDQRGLHRIIPEAARRGMGVIAKRPLANAPWRFEQRPHQHYGEEYWLRWKAMGLENDPELRAFVAATGGDWASIFTRYVTWAPGVHCGIVGSSRLAHLLHSSGHIDHGPLPEELTEKIHRAFVQHDPGWWTGQV